MSDRDESRRVAEAIRRMGPVFDDAVLKASYELYAPLQERAPRSGLTVHKDLAYGEDERQRLDVFVPELAHLNNAPVVIFFHGGDDSEFVAKRSEGKKGKKGKKAFRRRMETSRIISCSRNLCPRSSSRTFERRSCTRKSHCLSL